MSDGPGVILLDDVGKPLAVTDGLAVPSGQPAVVIAGTDGSNERHLKVDSSGRPVVVGAGVAGTPAGGVASVQGTVGGTPLPVSGTFTSASVGATGAAIPASADLMGGSDGTNLQALRVYDTDTGGGTEYELGVQLRKAASGGSVAFGTATDPVRTDPTGGTTQPVSAASLPLPTGAATEATLASVLTTANFQARINTLGQKTMANSTPVAIASDQSALPITMPAAATPTRTDVSGSASSVTILASNASRKGAILTNDSAAILYIRYGSAAATASDYSWRMLPREVVTIDQALLYTGQITGIWASATGACRITELT